MTGEIVFALTHTTPGGLREIWQDIAAGLRARGHPVSLLALYPGEPGLDEDAQADGWTQLAARRPRGIGPGAGLLRALVADLKRRRPAMIVTAMPAMNVLAPVAVALARTGTRVIVTHHSPADTHNAALDRVDGFTGALPCVAAVVSVSDAVGASLAHKPARYRAKRRTIRNALPERIEAMLDRLAETRDAAGDGHRIVAIGRLTAQKNYPQLIRAIGLLPDAALDIIGAGEDEAMLRALAAELGCAERVRWLGLLPREAALAHAARADIFAQVSLFEGHSLALVEAARLGLPLVVSDAPVQVEGVTAPDGARCGLVVPLGDARALADMLRALADDAEARAAWSASARALARQASRTVMLDAYQALLPEGGAGHRGARA